MSSFQNQSVGELVENIQLVIYCIGGMLAIFVGFVGASLKLLWSIYRKLTEHDSRLSKIDEKFADMSDRETGRSLLTNGIYGLSERTSRHEEAIKNLEHDVTRIQDTCDRRSESREYTGENRRK